MRLLNVDTLELEFFDSVEQRPPYAILSHTWETEEVLFEDWEPRDRDVISDLQNQLDALAHKLNLLNTNPTIANAYGALPESWGRFKEKPHIARAKKRRGWRKIDFCCAEARRYGIKYVWVDTLCIDKNVLSQKAPTGLWCSTF